jgi:acyl-CoA thioesterase FadM
MPVKSKCVVYTRIAETDALGVVYYGNVFVYFEVARHEFLKEIGCT